MVANYMAAFYNIGIMSAPIYDGLNPMQLLFVYEYMKDFKVGLAATRAGYSAHTASVQGCKMLNLPNVRMLIDKLMQERVERLKIDADWVLEEYKKLYHNCNLNDFITINENGQPTYDFSTATREQMAAIEGLSIAPGEWGTKIKMNLPAKERLLKQIGHHVGVQAWKEQIEVSEAVHLHFDKEDEDA